MKKRMTMIMAGLLLSLGAAMAQTPVRGTVVSSEDGQPVIGASVKVLGTGGGAVTDIEGRFSLTLPSGHNKLQVSSVGMAPQTVTVKGGTVRVVLEPDNTDLDEVLVVAYGTAKKSAFTGSAAVVSSEELSKSQVTSITNALYGARGSNGVIMITTKSAKKGKDATVTLDAKFGWNSKAIQQYDVISNPAQYYEMYYTAMNNYYLNKGYSTTEAWQNANANITTSNGGLGYNIWSYPEGQTLIGRNGKLNPNATLGRIVSYKGEDYLITPDDWEDVGVRTGIRQEYNVSVNGAGGGGGSYFASLGYLSNEGITYNSDLERISGRLRTDYQVKKWLKVGANLSFAHYSGNYLSDNGSESSTGNIWAFTSQMAPIYPAYIRDADGSIKVDSNGIEMMDYGDGLNAGMSRPFISDANPIQYVRLNTYASNGNAASANAYVDIDLAKGLKLTFNGTYNLDETRYNLVYNPYYGQFDSTGGTVEVEHARAYNYDLQQLLNYSTTIAGKHNISVMLGHEYYDDQDYVLYAAKSKMLTQDVKELDGAVQDGQSAASYTVRYNNEGWFGRALYDYDTRYFGSVSLRRDASSRFHPDHRWGTFWSAGAAWLINKEKFFKADWVDELKLKASIGSQGNDNIGDFRYTDLYLVSNSSGNIGTSFAEKGSEDITWESNTNFNAGFEFSLFKRLSGSIEYYYRKTTDMLFSFSVAPSLGYSSYYDNIGDMYNTGFELTLDYNAVRRKNVSWDITFNIASLKNRITKLHEDKKTTTYYDANGKEYKGYSSGTFFFTEGQSIYTWLYKDYAGVDPDTGESLWWKNVTETDANGNETVTGREKTATYSDADYYVTNKSSVPDFYGGFGTTLSLYGFDVSVNISFQIGGYQYDSTYATFMSSPTSSLIGYNFHKDLLNAWTADNPSANVPRFMYDDTYVAGSSTRFLTRSDYLNIENFNVGYTIPASITRKAGINSLRVYFAGENLGYISKRKGFDPRQSYTSETTATRYSPMRTMSFGMNVTF